MSALIPLRTDYRQFAMPVVVVAAASVLGLFAVVSPMRGLELAIGLLIAAIIFWDLAWGVVLFSAFVFLEAIPGILGPGVTLIKLMGFLLVASWLLAHMGRREKPSSLLRDRPLLAYALVAFVGWNAVSSLWSISSGAALSGASRAGQGVLLFFVVYAAIQTPAQLRAAMTGYVAGAAVTALIGLAGATGSDTTDATGRFAGSIGDPNYFAALLIPALAFALFMLLTERSRFTRFLLGSSALICAAALFLSASRGGIIALVVMIFAALVFAGPVRSRAVALIAAVVGVGVVYFALVAPPEALAHISAFGVGGGSGRTDLWAIAVRVFSDHPFLGVGANNFILVEPSYVISNLSLSSISNVFDAPHVTHNTYLQVLAELGLVGIAILGLIAFATFRSGVAGIRTAVQEHDGDVEVLVRALVIGLMGLLAAYIFLTAEYEKQLWLIFGLVAAGSSVARRLAVERDLDRHTAGEGDV